MLKPVWLVAFTGHRPGNGPGRSQSSLAACQPRIRDALKTLSGKAEEAGGSIELLTGVAAGADIEAAEVAKELKIPVHVILPRHESTFATDFEGDLADYWPRAETLISDSRNNLAGSTFRIADGHAIPPACYHDANLQMIRDADVLLAVANNEAASGIGGTQEVIDEAERMGLPIVVINPADNESPIHRGNFDSWPNGDTIIDSLNDNTFGETAPEGSPEPQFIFTKLTESAKQSAGKFRHRLKCSILLHFAATVLAALTAAISPVVHHEAENTSEPEQIQSVEAENGLAVASTDANPEHNPGRATVEVVADDKHHSLTLPQWLTIVELFLVSWAMFYIYRSHKDHSHHRWRQTRFAAELVRSSISSAGHLDPIRPMVMRHEPKWRRFAMLISLLSVRSHPKGKNLEAQKRSYINGRIKDQRDRYFKKQQPKAAQTHWWLATLSLLSAIIAFFAIGLALFLKLFYHDQILEQYPFALMAVFCPVFIPLLAGLATSFMLASDTGRRAERYQNLGDRLDRMACLAPGVKTPTALARIVEETEEVLLDELIEWYTASQNTGH